MSAKTLVDMLRAAGRDERLSTGALYLEAADEIERLEKDANRYRYWRSQIDSPDHIHPWHGTYAYGIYSKDELDAYTDECLKDG